MGDKRVILILLLILCSLLVAFFEIGLVSALVINADGTVDQPDVVERVGDVYTLTSDIFFELIVNRNNTIVDGDGHKISGFYAVTLSDVNNVTLKNCIITGGGMQIGVYLLRSLNCVISNNLITKTLLYNPKLGTTGGILVQGGGSHVISENNVTNNGNGIDFFQTTDNIVVGNSITDNYNGIKVTGSLNTIIYNNNFINNTNHVNDFGKSYDYIVYPSISTWDDGITGNYWSNYTGQDLNGDNIGDSPHFIYENNQDNYPIMTPLDIEVIPEFPSWTILPLFLIVSIALTVYKRKLTRSSQIH